MESKACWSATPVGHCRTSRRSNASASNLGPESPPRCRNRPCLNAPGDLICVYVEGSREEMLGVLSDLQNESHFPAAELTNTISFTALEEYARHAVPPQNGERTAADGEAARGAVAQTPAKPTGSQMAVSLPAATVNKILSAGQPSARGWGQPSSTSQAQQTPAPLFAASPKSDAEQLKADKQTAPKADQPGDKQRNALVARRKAPTPAGARGGASLSDRWQKESQEVAGDQRSFQIFFVLTDQSQSPAAPAASDAAKSSTATPKPTTAAQAAPAKQTTPSEAPAKPAAAEFRAIGPATSVPRLNSPFAEWAASRVPRRSESGASPEPARSAMLSEDCKTARVQI